MTDEIQKKIQKFKKKPNITEWMSILPMSLIVVLINKWNVDLSMAVLAGTVLATIIGRKNLSDKLCTFNASVANVGTASITTAVSVGFGGCSISLFWSKGDFAGNHLITRKSYYITRNSGLFCWSINGEWRWRM